MNQKNCMVAQSGGPTVAINASLAGVIDGVSASSMYDTVYGSLNGITFSTSRSLWTVIRNIFPALRRHLRCT